MIEIKKSGHGSPVVFLPWNESEESAKRQFSLEVVMSFKEYGFTSQFTNNDLVGIMPFIKDGELNGSIDFQYILTLQKLLAKSGVDSFLCDSTYKYLDRDDNLSKHFKRLKNGVGESYDFNRLPLFMLDGLDGKQEVIVHHQNLSEKISEDIYQNAYLARELNNLDGLIMMLKPSSHQLAGINGAVKALGFDLASKQGKVRHFSKSKPQVDMTKCSACGRCVHVCPARAISKVDRKIVIDEAKCINCGRCVESAFEGGIQYIQDATREHFQLLTSLYARSAMKVINDKCIFCSFLIDFGFDSNSTQSKMNIGILVSKDPVAIDQASVDLMKECSSEFDEMESVKLLETAQSLELGRRSYELITVAY